MAAGRPDDDLEPGEANKRDLDDMDERAKELEGDDEREAPTDEDDPEDYLIEEERAPRKERRSARYDELEAERDRERARAAALEAQLYARQPQQQAPPRPTFQEFAQNVNNELAELQKAEITLQSLAQNVDPASDAFQGLLAQKREIDLRRGELGYLYAQAKNAPPPQRQVAPEMAYMKQKYADVDNNPAGAAYAQAYYLQQQAKGLKKPPIEVVEESYQYARATMAGKPFSAASAGRPRPTVESKARLTGASTGGNGQGSQRRPEVVRMSKEDAQLAHETFKYEKDPQKRLQRYHKEIVLPRDRESNSERRRA